MSEIGNFQKETTVLTHGSCYWNQAPFQQICFSLLLTTLVICQIYIVLPCMFAYTFTDLLLDHSLLVPVLYPSLQLFCIIEMMERPYYMDYGSARLVIHKMVTSKYFDLAISAVIGLNVITMAMEFYMMPMVCRLCFYSC